MSFAAFVADMDRAVLDVLGGVPVTYTSSVGQPIPLTGMFDANYALATADAALAGVETVGPAVFLRLSDLPMHPKDEPDDFPTLVIAGVEYRVTERQPDDMGGIVLRLRVIS